MLLIAQLSLPVCPGSDDLTARLEEPSPSPSSSPSLIAAEELALNTLGGIWRRQIHLNWFKNLAELQDGVMFLPGEEPADKKWCFLVIIDPHFSLINTFLLNLWTVWTVWTVTTKWSDKLRQEKLMEVIRTVSWEEKNAWLLFNCWFDLFLHPRCSPCLESLAVRNMIFFQFKNKGMQWRE